MKLDLPTKGIIRYVKYYSIIDAYEIMIVTDKGRHTKIMDKTDLIPGEEVNLYWLNSPWSVMIDEVVRA